MIISDFTLVHFLEASKNRSKQSKDDRDFMALIGDTSRFTFQTSLLRTSRQILREAVPVYRKVTQKEVKILHAGLVDRILNEYREPDNWTTPSRGYLYRIMLQAPFSADIDSFAQQINGLEDWLKAGGT